MPLSQGLVEAVAAVVTKSLCSPVDFNTFKTRIFAWMIFYIQIPNEYLFYSPQMAYDSMRKQSGKKKKIQVTGLCLYKTLQGNTRNLQDQKGSPTKSLQ